MSWYEFLLFFHIAVVVIWVGGGAVSQFFALRILRGHDPARLAAFGADVEWMGTRVFAPSALLAFLSGILLVIDSDFLGFGDDWIVIGLILFAVTFLSGLLFLGPEAGRIGKLAEAEGPTSPAVQARYQRVIALSRADLMVLFLLIFDMSVKPAFDDVWLYVAVAVAAALGALLVRNGFASRIEAAPTTP
jgi:uncharacterized membrane protein